MHGARSGDKLNKLKGKNMRRVIATLGLLLAGTSANAALITLQFDGQFQRVANGDPLNILPPAASIATTARMVIDTSKADVQVGWRDDGTFSGFSGTGSGFVQELDIWIGDKHFTLSTPEQEHTIFVDRVATAPVPFEGSLGRIELADAYGYNNLGFSLNNLNICNLGRVDGVCQVSYAPELFANDPIETIFRSDMFSTGGSFFSGLNGVLLGDWKAQEVPEPTTLSLFALGALGLLRRRRTVSPAAI